MARISYTRTTKTRRRVKKSGTSGGTRPCNMCHGTGRVKAPKRRR